MRAGNLRHRVDIQVQTETPDGLGGSTLSWDSVSGMGSVPAAIWPTSAKERLDGMKLEQVITHKIRIRYQSGITSKNRILFGARVFNIVSILNFEERNKVLDMLCTEDL